MAEEIQFNAEDFQPQASGENKKKSSKWKYILALGLVVLVCGGGFAYWGLSTADNDQPPTLGEKPVTTQGLTRDLAPNMDYEFMLFEQEDLDKFERTYGEERTSYEEDPRSHEGIVSPLNTGRSNKSINYIHAPERMSLAEVSAAIDPEGTGGFAIAYWDPGRVHPNRIEDYRNNRNLGTMGKWVMTDNTYYPSLYNPGNVDEYIEIVTENELRNTFVDAGQMMIITTQRSTNIYGLLDGDNFAKGSPYNVCARGRQNIGFYGFAVKDNLSNHISEDCMPLVKGIWEQTALGGRSPWEKIYTRGEGALPAVGEYKFVWVLLDEGEDIEVNNDCSDKTAEEVVQAMADGIAHKSLYEVYQQLPPTQQADLQDSLDGYHNVLGQFNLGNTDRNVVSILESSAVIAEEHFDKLADFVPEPYKAEVDAFLAANPGVVADAVPALEYSAKLLENIGDIARDFDAESISENISEIIGDTNEIVDYGIRKTQGMNSPEANEVKEGLLVYRTLMNSLDEIEVSDMEMSDEDKSLLIEQANELGQELLQQNFVNDGEEVAGIMVAFSEDLVNSLDEFGIDLPADGMPVPMVKITDRSDGCQYWSIIGAREMLAEIKRQINSAPAVEAANEIRESLMGDDISANNFNLYIRQADGISEGVKNIFEAFAEDGEACKFLADAATLLYESLESIGWEGVTSVEFFSDFENITMTPQTINLDGVDIDPLLIQQHIDQIAPAHGEYNTETNTYTPEEGYVGEDWLIFKLQTAPVEANPNAAMPENRNGALIYCLDVQEDLADIGVDQGGEVEDLEIQQEERGNREAVIMDEEGNAIVLPE